MWQSGEARLRVMPDTGTGLRLRARRYSWDLLITGGNGFCGAGLLKMMSR
jgi:hypothetical protein